MGRAASKIAIASAEASAMSGLNISVSTPHEARGGDFKAHQRNVRHHVPVEHHRRRSGRIGTERVEHKNHELERRHVQEHLDAGRNALLQEFAGQGPAESEGGARIETAIAGFREELREQDDRGNEVPDERTVGGTGHAKRGNRAQTVNQYKVAGHVHDHAHKRCLHHNLRFANTAEEARGRIAH